MTLKILDAAAFLITTDEPDEHRFVGSSLTSVVLFLQSPI